MRHRPALTCSPQNGVRGMRHAGKDHHRRSSTRVGKAGLLDCSWVHDQLTIGKAKCSLHMSMAARRDLLLNAFGQPRNVIKPGFRPVAPLTAIQSDHPAGRRGMRRCRLARRSLATLSAKRALRRTEVGGQDYPNHQPHRTTATSDHGCRKPSAHCQRRTTIPKCAPHPAGQRNSRQD